MKKVYLVSISLFLLFVFYIPKEVDAVAIGNACDQYVGVSKIFWEGAELKYGQIGRLTVQQNTSLYKLDGSNKVFSKTLKKGEIFRIYAFKPGMLGLGGGLYIDNNSKIKYETPSKTKLDAAFCVNLLKNPPNPPTTPVVSNKKVYIFSNDGKYIGLLTTNIYDSDSVFNKYGTYGSKYSITCIWDEYGTYGSKYSLDSAFNPYTLTPPLIIDSNGNLLGKITVNPYVPGGINPNNLYNFAQNLGL